MSGDPHLAFAFVEALDDAALSRLAERIGPYISDQLTTRLPPTDSDRWLDARQAAAHLGLSVAALHKLTAARAIPFEQDGPGCRLWFRRTELDRWRQGGGRRARESASMPLPQRRRAAS
jgi:hypothetical protein